MTIFDKERFAVSHDEPARIPDGQDISDFFKQGGLPVQCEHIAVAPQVATYAMQCDDIFAYKPQLAKRIAKLLGTRYHLDCRIDESPARGDFAVEIARNPRGTILLGDIIQHGSLTTVPIGVDMTGNPVMLDISSAPHCLIAGTTGSGKSVLLNTIITSLAAQNTPEQVQLVLIDPKQVEMDVYTGLPHLWMPVVQGSSNALTALKNLCAEMDDRYAEMSRQGKKTAADAGYGCIVCVIDELADLMLTSKKDCESSIVRIAQLGRAAGIHLVVATQSPRAAVVTGLIRANLPTKVALTCNGVRESMIVLDHGGAEKLMGRGDALLKVQSSVTEQRLQCAYTPDADIANVVAWCRAIQKPVSKRKPKNHGIRWILFGD